MENQPGESPASDELDQLILEIEQVPEVAEQIQNDVSRQISRWFPASNPQRTYETFYTALIRPSARVRFKNQLRDPPNLFLREHDTPAYLAALYVSTTIEAAEDILSELADPTAYLRDIDPSAALRAVINEYQRKRRNLAPIAQRYFKKNLSAEDQELLGTLLRNPELNAVDLVDEMERVGELQETRLEKIRELTDRIRSLYSGLLNYLITEL